MDRAEHAIWREVDGKMVCDAQPEPSPDAIRINVVAIPSGSFLARRSHLYAIWSLVKGLSVVKEPPLATGDLVRGTELSPAPSIPWPADVPRRPLLAHAELMPKVLHPNMGQVLEFRRNAPA